ncbi:MAG: transposase [Anaerolineae bacterium]
MSCPYLPHPRRLVGRVVNLEESPCPSNQQPAPLDHAEEPTMPFSPDRHRRHSVRLAGHDYTQPCAYFLTICTLDRACLFGEVVDGRMCLNAYGQAVDACWRAIPDHFPHARCDAWVVMPNHVHGIIVFAAGVGVGARHVVPLPAAAGPPERFGAPVAGSLATIVRTFKAAATRTINALRDTSGAAVWQRGFFEHVVRDEDESAHIRAYIAANPARWRDDPDHPDRVQ